MKRDISQPFNIDETRFRDCFSAPSFRIFRALVLGWVLTVGKHTITRVILSVRLHESRHFATIYRFLSKAQWETDWVSRCLFRTLVETLCPSGCSVQVVIDDTLNNHCGKKICAAAYQYDGSASNRADKKSYGVCFVIIGLAVRLPGISERVFCLPYAARLWCPPKARFKPHNRAYKTKPELGLELLNLSHSWLKPGECLRVVADLGYCCETILKGRRDDIHMTGRLLKAAALFAPLQTSPFRRRGRPRKRGERLATPAEMFADPKLKWSEIEVACYGKPTKLLVRQFSALWYHSAAQEVLTIVLCRSPGKHSNMVLFDTDATSCAAAIVQRYAARWSIEVTNRETKQLLGSADPQCRTEQTVLRAPLFAYWSYCFVVLWFVRNYSWAKKLVDQPAPWYVKKKSFTFSDMLVAARRSRFDLSISPDAEQTNASTKINRSRSERRFDHVISAKL